MDISADRELLDEWERRKGDGQTLRDWAAEIGVPHETQRTRLKRARRKLQKFGSGRDPELNEIFQILRSRSVSVRELSKKFDRSEDTVRKWLNQMEADGYVLQQSETHVKAAKTSDPNAGKTINLPVIEDDHWIYFAVASDIHSGSNCCQPTALNMFVREAYESGIRHIFVPGDLTTGIFGYRGHEHDMVPSIRPRSRRESYLATKAQIWMADKYIPSYEGLTYYVIGGNHDWWHVVNSGLDAVAMLCKQRDDMIYLGYDVADVPLTKHVALRMWHPTGGVPYAVSYRTQKALEQVAFEELAKLVEKGLPSKIRFLLAGHLHIEVKFQRGPMAASQVGCFEGQTNYLKRKGLFPSIGGQLWRVRLNDQGQIYRIGYDWIPYPNITNDWENWSIPIQDEIVGEPDQVDILYSLDDGTDYAYGDHQYYGK